MTTTTKQSKAEQVYEEATRLLVEALESGQASPELWVKPWRALATRDFNPATKAQYRGGNALYTAILRMVRGWETAAWSTYGDADKGTGWLGLGRQVRKGEKGTHLIHWTVVPSKKETVVVAGVERPKMILIPNAFVVFNYHQTDPVEGAAKVWEPAATTAVHGEGRNEAAEAFFAAVPATVHFVPGSPSAFYDRRADACTVPAFEDFTSAAAYYGTLAHELAHWTGHESRLAREFGKRFGDEAYAVEELTAELAAVFTLSTLGYDAAGPRADHRHYLANWVAVLKADPKALYSIAGKAQKAADFLAGERQAEEPGSPDAGSTPAALVAA